LAKVLKPDDFIKELAYTYDIDLSSIGWFADSITKQKDELLSMVRKMAWAEQDNWPLAWIGWWQPLPWQEEQPQWQNMLPNVQAKWLPNVVTPETPWINNFSPAEKITM
jgi:hypothetical protein